MEEFIQRIPKHYVGEDCAQVWLGYQTSLTLFDKNGILFNQAPNYDYINQYLTDDRRHVFPYSNIPNHIERYQFFGRTKMTNQLLNFEQSYIAVRDGYITESFVMPDKDGALISTKLFSKELEEYSSGVRARYMTREELDAMFKASSSNQKVFLLSIDGNLYHSETMGYLSEDELVEQCKRRWSKQFEKCQKESDLCKYLDRDAMNFVENSIKNMTIDSVFDYVLNPIIYLVKVDGNDISVDMMHTTLVRKNYYKVIIRSIPITKYTLEQLKFLAPKIIDFKEPKIPLRLNPGVTREDIKTAKSLIKSKKH